MRSHFLAICVLLFGAMLSFAVLAQPGSGTRWEISMEMPGMPAGMGFSLPKQTACLSRDENEAPPADDKCTLLEQHSRGNRHFVKMQCPDGLTELDQTRTADSMTSLMKMTDSSGEVTEMTMKGIAIGDCDYTAETAKRERQIAGLQRQADDAREALRGRDGPLVRRCGDENAGHHVHQGWIVLGAQGRVLQAGQYAGWLPFAGGRGRSRRCGQDAERVSTNNWRCVARAAWICGAGTALAPRKQSNFGFVQSFCPDEAPATVPTGARHEAARFPVGELRGRDGRCSLSSGMCGTRVLQPDRREVPQLLCRLRRRMRPGVRAALSQQRDAADQGGATEGKQGVTKDVKAGVKEGVKNLKKVFGF